MIEKLRDYLLKYDFFDLVGGFINVNYLDADIGSFSIEPLPTKPIIKHYVNRDLEKQYEFCLVSKDAYSNDDIHNIESCGFFEDFENWIINNNINKVFPEIEGVEMNTIEVTSNGVLVTTESNECIYQISFKLTYLKRYTNN